jgi:hypothetical protein
MIGEAVGCCITLRGSAAARRLPHTERIPQEKSLPAFAEGLTWLIWCGCPAIVVALRFFGLAIRLKVTGRDDPDRCLLPCFYFRAREHIVHPLQTISNLSLLREGDYSIRARGASANNALGEVLLEINSPAKRPPATP